MSKMSDKGRIGDRSKNGVNSPGSNILPDLSQPLSQAYREFYASLTPEQLESLGGKPHPSNLTGEINPSYKYATSPDDWEKFSESRNSTVKGIGRAFFNALATYDRDPVDEQEISTTPPNHLHMVVVMELLRKVLMIYTNAPDPATRLHGDTVALALGFPGLSVGGLARKYGITRQAASKRLRNIIKALDLPPTQRMLLHATSPISQAIKKSGITIPLTRPKKKRKARGNSPNA